MIFSHTQFMKKITAVTVPQSFLCENFFKKQSIYTCVSLLTGFSLLNYSINNAHIDSAHSCFSYNPRYTIAGEGDSTREVFSKLIHSQPEAAQKLISFVSEYSSHIYGRKD